MIAGSWLAGWHMPSSDTDTALLFFHSELLVSVGSDWLSVECVTKATCCSSGDACQPLWMMMDKQRAHNYRMNQQQKLPDCSDLGCATS